MIHRDVVEKREAKKARFIRKEATKKAKKVAALLKKKYKATRVILFGSLISNDYLHEKSDIDILVEGMNTKDILQAGFEACLIAAPFNVDIIPLEKADKSLLKNALSEGIEI